MPRTPSDTIPFAPSSHTSRKRQLDPESSTEDEDPAPRTRSQWRPAPFVPPPEADLAANQQVLRDAGFARAQKGTKFGTQRLLSKLAQLEKKIREKQTGWMERISLVAEWEGTEELWKHKLANQRRVGVDPEKVEWQNRRKKRQYAEVKKEAEGKAAEAEGAKKKIYDFVVKNWRPPRAAAKAAPKTPKVAGRKITKDAVVDLSAGRSR